MLRTFVPAAAVERRLDRIARCVQPARPVDLDAAELAHGLEVDLECLRRRAVGSRAAPHRARLAVDGEGRAASGRFGRCFRCRWRNGALRPQRLQRQAIEPQAPVAAFVARGEHELDRLELPQRAIGRRTPREVDLPPLDPHLLPVAGELMVRAAEPPDVVAGRIDELHLEVVAPGLGRASRTKSRSPRAASSAAGGSPLHSRRCWRD